MRSPIVALIWRCAASALLMAAAPALCAAPLSVETFFQKARYGEASLSPSGRYIAVLTPVSDRGNVTDISPSGRYVTLRTRVSDRRQVAIIDLQTRKVDLSVRVETGDALGVLWQSDERMVVSYGDLQRGSGEPPRVFGQLAMDRDGSNQRGLGKSFSRQYSLAVLRAIPGTDDLLVTARDRTVDQADLYRLNTRTGAKELLSFDTPGNVQQWVLDFDHVPRAIRTSNLRDDTSAWYVRVDAKSPWKPIWQGKSGAPAMAPMAFSPDGATLYLRSREKRDLSAIYELDVASGKMSEPIIKHVDRDMAGSFVLNVSQRKILGFAYDDDRPSRVWIDAEHARTQKGVDAVLPDTVNVIQKASEGDRWLVVAYSDREPGTVYLLDGKARSVEKLFDYVPWFKPAELGKSRWVRYKARDGLVIPALLTVPSGAKGGRVPLVVDIHGGPYVPSARWGFNVEVQFLVSRGYAVLQPQFRGTLGFGWKHQAAGFRKWGEEMQDDLEDGVKWAVAEGIADADRVCFYGASYGGYAAMWGAIKNRDLIKCAVAFVGVSSIDYLFDNAQTDLAEYAEHSSQMVRRVGDPKTERARFKRVNPLDNADRVGVPILLAYGALDRRVPLVHGTDFRAALERHGKVHEWVVYGDEAHGFSRTENVVDFYKRVEAFLARYLKP